VRGVNRRDLGSERTGLAVGSLAEFLALSRADVMRVAESVRTRTPAGTTWLSLSALLERRGYRTVGDLGREAAISWAWHLGVITSEQKSTALRAAGTPNS
jgi:hypothetical protein